MQFPNLEGLKQTDWGNPAVYENSDNKKLIRVWTIPPINGNNTGIRNRAFIDAVLSEKLTHKGLIKPDSITYSKNGTKIALTRPLGASVKEIPSTLTWDKLQGMLLELVCVVEGLHKLEIANLAVSPKDLAFFQKTNSDPILALSKFATQVELRVQQTQKFQEDLRDLVESLLQVIARVLVRWLKQDQEDVKEWRISPDLRSNLVGATAALQNLSNLSNTDSSITTVDIKKALGIIDANHSCTPISVQPENIRLILEGQRLHSRNSPRNSTLPIAQVLTEESDMPGLKNIARFAPVSSLESVSAAGVADVSHPPSCNSDLCKKCRSNCCKCPQVSILSPSNISES